MKALVSLMILVTLLAGCASTGHRPASTRSDGVNEEARKLAMEAKQYEEADVRGEVETRLRAGDLRFKGWQEKISDTIVTLPGISQEEGRKLERLKLPTAEVLFWGDLQPFVVVDETAYEKKTQAMFAYMKRFNRALFLRLEADEKTQSQPIQRATDNDGAAPHRV